MTDLELMRQPAKWPAYPFLPIRHRTEKEENRSLTKSGFLYVDIAYPYDNQPPPAALVYFGNMFSVGYGDIDLEELPTREYASLEAVAAEWYVD